jgi:hypothetical protein
MTNAQGQDITITAKPLYKKVKKCSSNPKNIGNINIIKSDIPIIIGVYTFANLVKNKSILTYNCIRAFSSNTIKYL